MKTLVFVYNADSGFFNMLADIAHKTFSPETYSCSLCAMTYDRLGMKKEWREFLAGLDRPMEFLHRDELRERYGVADAVLPAVFAREGDSLAQLISAEEISSCRTLDDLEKLLLSRVPAE